MSDDPVTDALKTINDAYYDQPMTLTPHDVTTSRVYEGEFHMFTSTPESLTISLPIPPRGIYRYRITVERIADSPQEPKP